MYHFAAFKVVADISALNQLKEKIKSITRKTIPASFDERIEKLNRVMSGWINYFPDISGLICIANLEILMYGYVEDCDAAFGPAVAGEETRP